MKNSFRKLANGIRNDRLAQLAHLTAKVKQSERARMGKLRIKRLAEYNKAKKDAAARGRLAANPRGLYYGPRPLIYVPGCRSVDGDIAPYLPFVKKEENKIKEDTLLKLAKLPNLTLNPYIRLSDGTWTPRVKVPFNMVSEIQKISSELKTVSKDGVFNIHWANKVVKPIKQKVKSVWYSLKKLYGRIHSPTDPNGYICNFRPGSETYYPMVTVPCEMSAEKAQTFVKLFNKQPRMREGDSHDHPLCANVRWLAQKFLEEEMDNLCEKNNVQPCYLDCFGSARFQENTNKWSAQPVITVGDSQRLRGKRCCNCNPIECRHIKQSVSFSVDSVYYMNPEQIAALCANTRLKQHHVLFHRMLNHTGSYLNGEYRWTTVKCNDELYNKVWIGGKDTGNIYQSKIMDWLNVRAWPTSKGWLYYSFKKNIGVMESGFFLLSDDKLIHTPVEQSDDTIEIVSWEMDGPERNGNWYTSIRDWIKTNVFQTIGVINRYKLVTFKIPISLYTKLVQCAIFSDVGKRMELIPELKGVARRWKSDQEQRGIYLDEMYFVEYLPHVIAAALTVSLPAEFGALHKNYINDYFVQNKGLWRQSYSQAGRLCVTLAAFTATVGVLSFGLTVWASVLTLVAAGCAACIALLKGKEKEQGIRSSFIMRSSICHGTDVEGFYDFLMAIPVQRLPIELRAIPGFTDILEKQMTVRNRQKYLTILAPLLSQYKTECGCAFSDERKKTICSFVEFEGIEPRCMVNCTCNFISAMTQRYFRLTPEQDENLWQAKWNELIATGSKFLDHNLNVDLHRPLWYKGLATHKKKAVDRALTYGDNKGYHFVNPSVKQEITLSQTAANKAYKPRVYFPKSNLHYAETGPYMYALKKMLNRNMNGIKNPVLFACGFNPMQLGDALQKGLNKWLPNDTLRLAYECDLKTCESTMCGYMIPLEAQLCHKAGVPQNIINKLYDKECCSGVYQKKITNETISFKMKNCRESGTTNTSVGNSLIYTTILTQSLQDLGVNQYFILVGGDDAVIYFYKCDYDRVKEVFNQVKRYGLEPETVFRKNYLAARFYSGFFLPCSYKKEEHWIHTLSVGKAFVKAFNYRVKPDLHPETWLKETAKQREVMWNHCPILNLVPEFVGTQLKDAVVKKQPVNMDLGGFMYDDRMKYSVEESKETKHVLASIYDMDVTEIDSLEKDLRYQFSGDWYGRKISSIGLTRMLDLDL